MRSLTKSFSLALGLFLVFSGPLLASSEKSGEMCAQYSPESNLKFKNLLSSIPDDGTRDQFLLDSAICTQPEKIFEYEFSGLKNGLLKIQAVCNVITIYVAQGSTAHDKVFGEIAMVEDPQASMFLSLITGRMLTVEVPMQVSKGLTDTVYGDESLYHFIHRNDESHKEKHKSKDEAEVPHCHIEHIGKDSIKLKDMRRLARTFESAGLINDLVVEDILLTFGG